MTSTGFLSGQTWISLQQYWISLTYVNPRKVTLRQHARNEAGSWPFEKDLLFMVESFYCPSQKLHTLTALPPPAPVAPSMYTRQEDNLLPQLERQCPNLSCFSYQGASIS